MTNKLFPPLGAVPHRVSQTYHGEDRYHPDDLSLQCAVDIGAVKGTHTYAPWDAKIVNVIHAGEDSYITFDIGLPWWVLYVHVDTKLKIGDIVKKGDVVGWVESDHIHEGLKNKNEQAPHPELMDYMDRGVEWYATHPDIKKIWCNEDGDLEWGRFKDLAVVTAPPAVIIGEKYKLTSNVKLRKGTGTNTGVIRVMKEGGIVSVASKDVVWGTGYYWVKIHAGEDTGHMAWGFAEKVGSAPDPCDMKVKLATEGLQTLLNQEQGKTKKLQKSIEMQEDYHKTDLSDKLAGQKAKLEEGFKQTNDSKDKTIKTLNTKITRFMKEGLRSFIKRWVIRKIAESSPGKAKALQRGDKLNKESH